MTNEPQSIRELHHLLSKLHQEYYVEMAELLSIASSTSNSARRTPHSAVEQAAKLNTPSVLISEQQILAILDVSKPSSLVLQSYCP